MSDKQSEMSIDEVLSSIKQMVVDKDPPVLELTDMISPDGGIVRLKQGCEVSDRDMKSFLRLAQENGEVDIAKEKVITENVSPIKEKRITNDSGNVLGEIIREVATPLIKDWLSANFSKIVRDVVKEEVHKVISNEIR